MSRPRALDLFCGGGLSARGLIAAGFDVTGVDIADHSRSYPGHFIRGDALAPPVEIPEFDLVWASPPCQAYSRGGKKDGRHPRLIEPTRELLTSARRSVIEGVSQRDLRPDLWLTGPMFGLDLIRRKRFFELSGFWCWQPLGRVFLPTMIEVGVRGGKWRGGKGQAICEYRDKAATTAAMGISDPGSLTVDEIGEGIPPAYAEHIGRAALEAIRSELEPSE